MAHILDNIFWHALNGHHVHFSTGTDRARRYAPGFSPISAFPDPANPDFAALAPFCAPGESLYCADWSGDAPPGWRIDVETTMFRMVWNGAAPARDDAPDAIVLGPEHAPKMLALAEQTRPGPFGLRTVELGDYFGYFDGDRLIAMAGERTSAPGLREVSGVCTDPAYQGRGYARRLMNKVILRQLQRDERTFLHVMRNNEAAHALYLRMGFEDYCETTVRVMTAPY